MEDIKKLQELWKKQRVKSLDKVESDKIVKNIRSFVQKQFRINIVKSIAVAIILIFFVVHTSTFTDFSPMLYLGVIWILLSVSVTMVFYWKKQFKKSDLKMNQPETEFLKSTINKLGDQKRIMRIILFSLSFSLIFGINIIYFELFKEYAFTERVINHISFTFLLIAFSFAGLKIRDRKFKIEFQPLINDLTLTLDELEKI